MTKRGKKEKKRKPPPLLQPTLRPCRMTSRHAWTTRSTRRPRSNHTRGRRRAALSSSEASRENFARLSSAARPCGLSTGKNSRTCKSAGSWKRARPRRLQRPSQAAARHEWPLQFVRMDTPLGRFCRTVGNLPYPPPVLLLTASDPGRTIGICDRRRADHEVIAPPQSPSP